MKQSNFNKGNELFEKREQLKQFLFEIKNIDGKKDIRIQEYENANLGFFSSINIPGLIRMATIVGMQVIAKEAIAEIEKQILKL